MDVKGELLKLAYKKLDETARLLKLALEAEELAVKVDLAEAALHRPTSRSLFALLPKGHPMRSLSRNIAYS
jgi:hypothetical protein